MLVGQLLTVYSRSRYIVQADCLLSLLLRGRSPSTITVFTSSSSFALALLYQVYHCAVAQTTELASRSGAPRERKEGRDGNE